MFSISIYLVNIYKHLNIYFIDSEEFFFPMLRCSFLYLFTNRKMHNEDSFAILLIDIGDTNFLTIRFKKEIT